MRHEPGGFIQEAGISCRTPDEKMAFAMSDAGRKAVKEYLSSLEGMNEIISARKAVLKAMWEKTGNASHSVVTIQGGSISDKVGDTAAEIADVKRELLEDQQALLDQRREIEETIGRIKDETQQRILEMRYLYGLPIFKIASALHYDERSICRMHRAALTMIALIKLEDDDVQVIGDEICEEEV